MMPNEIDRDYMISFCTLKSGYSIEFFEKLTESDLSEEYQNRLNEEK